MTDESIDKGRQLQRQIETLKYSLRNAYSDKGDKPDTIKIEIQTCALPNNFWAAYKCNLEIEIQRLEQEFKNL